MEWIGLAMDHSAITIGFLVLCLLLLNFGTVVWVVIIGGILFVLSKSIVNFASE